MRAGSPVLFFGIEAKRAPSHQTLLRLGAAAAAGGTRLGATAAASGAWMGAAAAAGGAWLGATATRV